MTEPRAVLVGAPDHWVSMLGEALAPALPHLEVVRCADLVSGECTIEAMATALGARPRPTVLIGDRAGALVVLHLLAANPDAAACAVLMRSRTTPSALEQLEAAELVARGRAVHPRALALLRAASILSPSGLADDAALTDLLGRLRTWPQESAAETAVLDLAARTHVDAETLAAVTTPCLVLGATLDPVTSPHAARAVAAGLPSATLRIVDGGPFDVPGAEIRAFAESVRVAS